MANMKTRLDRLEKQTGAGLPPFIREIERNGPKDETEQWILSIQRHYKGPGMHPYLECLARLGSELADD